jgi:predicted ABC-type transport system involved in lysophospholipase L1 biosynthesis ATPase subunit
MRDGSSQLHYITHDHALAARMPRQVEMLDGHIVRDTAQGPRP